MPATASFGRLSQRTQNNADGIFALGRQVAINKVIHLQFPDQIVIELAEADLDLALRVISMPENQLSVSEIQALPRLEKLRLLEALWDDLSRDAAQLELPAACRRPRRNAAALGQRSRTSVGLGASQSHIAPAAGMKVRILTSACRDLAAGQRFYGRQGADVGEYFSDSVFADIDSLV